MPSIMDLVREYSELEMRRSQRGGMLEPQAEIRYQALKFFLEFDLFPLPSAKIAEQVRSYEKKKPVSTSEINKPAEENIEKEIISAGIKEETLTEPSEPPPSDSVAQELVSVISETSLPVSETPAAPASLETEFPVNKPEEIPAPQVDLKTIETQTQLNKEEVLDMVDAIDEAVENIVIPETAENPDNISATQQATQDNTVLLQDTPAGTEPEKTELVSHIDNAFDNVIAPEDPGRTADQVVLENILPEFPQTITGAKGTEPQAEGITTELPDITEVVLETQPPKEAEPAPVIPAVNEPVTTGPGVNIDELLKPITPSSDAPQPDIASQPINIDEIVPNTQTEEFKPEMPAQTGPNPLQIDFLSGLGIAPQTSPPAPESQVNTDNQPNISIEEILPADFITVAAETNTTKPDRVFIDSPSKAAVHMVDGDARRGIIKELRETMNEVELFDDETFSNSTRIHISDIKAIFVMKHPGEKGTGAEGQRLNVRFKDDRSISGISPDYSDDAAVFTLYPADGTQSARMIIVYRGFVEQVDRL